MLRKYSLYFAWLVALVGTLLSLYFSEVKHMNPCHLCWYQRICLFPLVLILGIATYKNFSGIAAYTLPLAIIGLFFGCYQIALQEIPGFDPISICGAGPSCSEKNFIGLGPITIPMISAFGFLLLTFFLSFAWGADRSREKEHS